MSESSRSTNATISTTSCTGSSMPPGSRCVAAAVRGAGEQPALPVEGRPALM
jgi:hypothetical protein